MACNVDGINTHSSPASATTRRPDFFITTKGGEDMGWYDDSLLSDRYYNAALAEKIGLNETLFLCQIMYWLRKNKETEKNFREGRYWTYNSVEQWKEQFPWWHQNTIRNIIKSLRDSGCLITGKFNKNNYDQTRWYTVDYEAVSVLMNEPCNKFCEMSHNKFCEMRCNKFCEMKSTKFVRPIPDNILRITYREYDNNDMVTEVNFRDLVFVSEEKAEALEHITEEKNLTLTYLIQKFGAQATLDALDLVSKYINHYYPRYRHELHPPVKAHDRIVDAHRILLCSAAIVDESLDTVDEALEAAAEGETKFDPLVENITGPKALGYWVSTKIIGDYNSVGGSSFDYIKEGEAPRDLAEVDIKYFRNHYKPRKQYDLEAGLDEVTVDEGDDDEDVFPF